MRYANFPTSGMCAVTSCMLHQLGHQVSDVEIAIRACLPWMIAQEDGVYRAGTALDAPKWMDLALLPLGFRMIEEVLPAEDVCARLKTLPTAAMVLPVVKGVKHWVVYTGMAERRFRFQNMRLKGSQEPRELLLTPGMIRKELSETAVLRTLVPVAPQAVDMRPYLMRSLKTMVTYHHELRRVWDTYIDRPDYPTYRRTIFRPLLSDLAPLTPLTGDASLPIWLTNLRDVVVPRLYSRLLVLHLQYHLDFSYVEVILNCFRELICDRLYDLGADEDMMEEAHRIAALP